MACEGNGCVSVGSL